MTWWNLELRRMDEPCPEGQEPREAWWETGRTVEFGPSFIGWTLFFALGNDTTQVDWDVWMLAVTASRLNELFGDGASAGLPADGHLALALGEE